MGKTKTDKNPKHCAHFLKKIKVCCDSGGKKEPQNLYTLISYFSMKRSYETGLNLISTISYLTNPLQI